MASYTLRFGQNDGRLLPTAFGALRPLRALMALMALMAAAML